MKTNAKGMIVFPGGLRMYLQRDISTGAQRPKKVNREVKTNSQPTRQSHDKKLTHHRKRLRVVDPRANIQSTTQGKLAAICHTCGDACGRLRSRGDNREQSQSTGLRLGRP